MSNYNDLSSSSAMNHLISNQTPLFPLCVCMCRSRLYMCVFVIQAPHYRSCWEKWVRPLFPITPTTARRRARPPCPPPSRHSRVPHPASYSSWEGSPWASDPSFNFCFSWSTRDSPSRFCSSSDSAALWTFSQVGNKQYAFFASVKMVLLDGLMILKHCSNITSQQWSCLVMAVHMRILPGVFHACISGKLQSYEDYWHMLIVNVTQIALKDRIQFPCVASGLVITVLMMLRDCSVHWVLLFILCSPCDCTDLTK